MQGLWDIFEQHWVNDDGTHEVGEDEMLALEDGEAEEEEEEEDKTPVGDDGKAASEDPEETLVKETDSQNEHRVEKPDSNTETLNTQAIVAKEDWATSDSYPAMAEEEPFQDSDVEVIEGEGMGAPDEEAGSIQPSSSPLTEKKMQEWHSSRDMPPPPAPMLSAEDKYRKRCRKEILGKLAVLRTGVWGYWLIKYL